MMASRRILPVYPIQGSSPIADKIRVRRGSRGLTPLDGTLLRCPPIANGWNQLLGAVRTEGKLPGDIRELMILRVAAHNYAAFEWIHHEHVGRDAGLTTSQLVVVRDVLKPAPPPSAPGLLTSLQAAALAFADASTKEIKVSDAIFNSLSNELNRLSGRQDVDSVHETVQNLLVEAAAVVATYNMVSRFLVSLDVAGKSNELVPWPVDRTEKMIPIPQSETDRSPTALTLHAVTLTVPTPSPRPWLIFANSLLTNTDLWSLVTPALISKGFNLILFDQRGHGLSSIPEPPECSISDLADDIIVLLDHFGIARAHAIIGVSQGGAAALSFALRHPDRVAKIIACCTRAKTPEANVGAWNDKIEFANSSSGGMGALAVTTAQRWFPEGSIYHPTVTDPNSDVNADNPILKMITSTSLLGFETGVRALQRYDLLADGLLKSKTKTLLLAGQNDAGGSISNSLRKLQEEWESLGGDVKFAQVDGAGHLPMMDKPDEWLEVISAFLEK